MPFIVDDIAAGAIAVKGISSAATEVWNKVGSLFRGSPPVNWDQANDLAVPSATDITRNIVEAIDEDKVPAILAQYASKLKAYVRNSPHNPGERDSTIRAIDLEAVGTSGGFKPNGFPFDRLSTVQLAWAIWLHAHWLYGGVSQDEVGNGNALRKFNESLLVTLTPAVQEATGFRITETGSTGMEPGSTGTETKVQVASTASLFSNQWVALAIGLGLVLALVKLGGRK